jgi:hypothetical protein
MECFLFRNYAHANYEERIITEYVKSLKSFFLNTILGNMMMKIKAPRPT